MSSPKDVQCSYFFAEDIGVYASVEAQMLKPHIVKYAHGPTPALRLCTGNLCALHPLRACVLGRLRRMTHELIKAYDLPKHLVMCQCGKQWSPATVADLNRFHTDMYVSFLQQLTSNGASVIDEVLNHVLNASVCFTETAWLYSALYAGGSLAAAQALVAGDDIAINLMGGQTHARRDCASGFSYVNDVVLAILHLLRAVPGSLEDPSSGGDQRRVMFVNLDGWHCSGVEEAFYTTDRVLCLSLHRYAEGVYPGSGGRNDCGQDAGKHHNINLPVSDGLDDAGLELLLMPVLKAAAERYCPHCIVCCAGAGVISGDRLGCMNISIAGHASVMKAIAELGVPLLVLGGGGFSQLNSAKAWVSATAALCGVELPEELPGELPSLECYPPSELSLSVPPATMEDMNTDGSLTLVRDGALKAIEQMPQRTKPLARAKRSAAPPEAPAAEAASEGAAPTSATGATEGANGGDAAGGAVAGSGEGASPGGVPAAPAEAPTDAAVKVDAEMGEGAAADGEAPMELDAPAATGEGVAADALDSKGIEERMQAEEPGLGDDD